MLASGNQTLKKLQTAIADAAIIDLNTSTCGYYGRNDHDTHSWAPSFYPVVYKGGDCLLSRGRMLQHQVLRGLPGCKQPAELEPRIPLPPHPTIIALGVATWLLYLLVAVVAATVGCAYERETLQHRLTSMQEEALRAAQQIGLY